MKTNSPFTLLVGLLCVLFSWSIAAQPTGPFSPEDWPESSDASKSVHYVNLDQDVVFDPVGDNWFEGDLTVLSGSDDATAPISIGGHNGLKVTGSFLNVADQFFDEWAETPVIDILMQVYGNEAVLGGDGEPRNFNFLTGTLPELNFPVGGSLPVEAKNSQWNWVLFRIENGIRSSDGSRFVGSIPANAQGASQNGGVNGGTIRMEGVPGLIVRVIAFGEEGAFGSPEQVNLFADPPACDPEPETNYVYVDIAAGTSDHLEVLNGGDQTVVFEDNVGPDDDKRRAVRPDGSFMNFGITDNYLGLPCNDPRTVKFCVEFYDDPAQIGTVFGPEAYATDAVGGIAFVPANQRHTLLGTGQWIRRSFTVGAVSLAGVNTAPLTGAARFVFSGGEVFLSRVDLVVFRVGDHPLAGDDPLSDCVNDPLICTDEYGNFAELDLHNGIQDGLAPGTSAGDQNMIQEEAGPDDDRRMAIRPAFDDGAVGFPHIYMNFAIVDQPFGPTTQPNAHLAICVTYYDDPELEGESFRPEVYQSERGGQVGLAFTSGAIAVPLQGTGRWRDAYFEIPDMKFNGVNQGPQAAARFVFSDKIFFSRVRYAVIRPCGPMEGVNLLEECKPIEPPVLALRRAPDNSIILEWPVAAMEFNLQQTTNILLPEWTNSEVTPTVEGEVMRAVIPVSGVQVYYRLSE